MSELLEKVAALLEERKNYGISGDSRLSDWRWRAAAELPNVAEELRVALLQIGELKKALYDECVGSACAPAGECYGGYRKCSGCEERAKIAYGPGWGGIVEKPKCEPVYVCNKCGYGGPWQRHPLCNYLAVEVPEKRKEGS
jgi:hypothetical protein